GTDCDDFDPGVSPGAEDPVVDGVDADCDGVDGLVDDACVPSGPEDCDGVDDDCDGLVDDPFLTAVAGSPAVVAAGALLDGGEPALVVGDTSDVPTEDGAVALYDRDGQLVVRIVGTDQSPTFGQQVATGRDLTGDGLDDLVVAAPFATVDGVANRGRVFVFAGPIDAATTLGDAVSVFVGGDLPGQPGASLALAPDLTGDGRAELLVGYYRHVLLFSGVPPAEAGVADAFATWERSTGGGAWSFATAPDADGDGLPELLLGMPTWGGGVGEVTRWDSHRIGGAMGAQDAAWTGGGIGGALVRVGDALWTLAGTIPVRLGDTDVDALLPYDASGLANAGDLDGDGAEDLLVADTAGLVAVGADGEIGRIAPSGGALSLQSDRSLAAPTDLDGDGVPDPRVRTDTHAAAVDGALGFAGACDADGDGVGEGDCDDGDASVAPLYGRDVCNGVDDDCDGVVDSPAEVPLPTRAVWASGLGDLDGDALAEVGTLDADGILVVAGGGTEATVTGGRPDEPSPFAGVGDTDGN
ncbi:MAG: integrin alpha, partial [Myxococcota bacterium]